MTIERSLLIMLMPLVLMLVLDAKGWWCRIAGQQRFEGTRYLARIPLEMLQVMMFTSVPVIAFLAFGPCIYTSSTWFATHVASEYTQPGAFLCLGIMQCLALAVSRRGTKVEFPASRLLFCREHDAEFSFHFSPRRSTHLSPPFRRIVPGAERELVRAVQNGLTPPTLAALQAAGVGSLTVASAWLRQDESTRRLEAVFRFLAELCPGGRVEVVEVPVGWYETAWIRLIQRRMKSRGFNKVNVGRTMMRFWIAAAEKDNDRRKTLPGKGGWWYFLSRVRMPGVRLVFPDKKQTHQG